MLPTGRRIRVKAQPIVSNTHNRLSILPFQRDRGVSDFCVFVGIGQRFQYNTYHVFVDLRRFPNRPSIAAPRDWLA